MRTTIGAALLSAVAMLVLPGIADATWPGQNGKVIFVCRGAGVGFSGQDICSINPDGSGLANLTNTPSESEGLPEVSRDGTQISYTRGSTVDTTHIWVMNLDGSSPRELTTVPSDGTAWTPDGQIAFRQKVSEGVYEFRKVPSTGGASTLMRAATGSDFPPRFTTDGKWLYGKFVPVPPDNLTDTQQVFVVDGMTETQVTVSTPGLTSNNFPSWSPDGASILYIRSDFTPGFGYDDDIYKVPSGGGAEVQLTNTNGPVDERWPSLSPDGTRLLYHGEDGTHDFSHQFLTIANADGSNPVPVATPTLDYAAFPVWAPVVGDDPPPGPQAAFTATAPKKAKSTKPVPVTLRCIGNTQCAVVYGASLSVPRKGKPAKKFTIKSKSVTLQAGTDKTVNLKVPGAAKGLVKKALNAGKAPVLNAVATANQPGGPLIRKVKLTIRLKK